MNEQVLSPAIEKALADLRQAIIEQLQSASAPAPVVPEISPVVPVESPIAVTPVAPEMPTVTPPAPEQVEIPVVPTPIAPAAPAPVEPVSNTILPDLSASPSNVTDLSGVAPEAPVSMSANNGLDDSAPIAPPTPVAQTAPALDLTAGSDPGMPAPTLPDLTAPVPPTPAMPETPVAPAPAATPTIAPSTGLPKANSLLSNVLKKGWNSNQ